MKPVYVDNNATTQVAHEVVEAMLPYFTEQYGNPGSMHTFGGEVMHAVDHARQQVADLLGAESPTEVVFNSCGTESDNTAIMGTLLSYPEKKHIVTTKVEHHAVLSFCETLERRGYSVTYLGVDAAGMIGFDELAAAITEETAIVSIMWANNETGVVFPVEQIAELVHESGCIFHTDAVQIVGKLPMSVKDTKIDLLSLSGHKLHAPKGIGALYIRRGARVRPMMIGGHQERGRRAGTESVTNIVGMGKAAELAQEKIEQEQTYVQGLRDKLQAGILATCPNARVNGDIDWRLPNTANISFEFVEGEAILLLLNEHGICASSGSACTSGSLEPSHVLRAMGVPFTAAHGSIRFSLSRYNTEAEIDFILEKLPPIITRLRALSPFGRDEQADRSKLDYGVGMTTPGDL